MAPGIRKFIAEPGKEKLNFKKLTVSDDISVNTRELTSISEK